MQKYVEAPSGILTPDQTFQTVLACLCADSAATVTGGSIIKM
jgi:hypothetical protein